MLCLYVRWYKWILFDISVFLYWWWLLFAVDCRDSESDVDYLHRREDASSDVCRIDRVDMSISLPSFNVDTPPPPYAPPKMMCVFPAYEEAPPPYESISRSHSSETVVSERNVSHSAWFTLESIWILLALHSVLLYKFFCRKYFCLLVIWLILRGAVLNYVATLEESLSLVCMHRILRFPIHCDKSVSYECHTLVTSLW